MAEVPHLRCWMLSGDPSERKLVEDEGNTAVFGQEPGKKSAFILNPDGGACKIGTPAHLMVEYRNAANQNSPFFLGGFQIVSNAKHVEVYVTDNDGKESYLFTSKGISLEKGDEGEEWHKAVSVVPGGPRSVTWLHIKLLSLKPKETEVAFLQFLKITARIPGTFKTIPSTRKSMASTTTTTTTTATGTAAASHLGLGSVAAAPVGDTSNVAAGTSATSAAAQPSAPVPAAPSVSQADFKMALSSLSLMAKSTEDRIEAAMGERFAKMEGFLESRWSRLEGHVYSLTSVVVDQKRILEQKKKLIEQQNSTIRTQEEQLQVLLAQHKHLGTIVESLAGEVTVLRTELKSVSNREKELFDSFGDKQLQHDEAITTQVEQMKLCLKRQEDLAGNVEDIQSNISSLRDELKSSTLNEITNEYFEKLDDESSVPRETSVTTASADEIAIDIDESILEEPVPEEPVLEEPKGESFLQQFDPLHVNESSDKVPEGDLLLFGERSMDVDLLGGYPEKSNSMSSSSCPPTANTSYAASTNGSSKVGITLLDEIAEDQEASKTGKMISPIPETKQRIAPSEVNELQRSLAVLDALSFGFFDESRIMGAPQ